MLRKKRTRRRSRWLPKQPRLGARMCQGTFFSLFACLFLSKSQSTTPDQLDQTWVNA